MSRKAREPNEEPAAAPPAERAGDVESDVLVEAVLSATERTARSPIEGIVVARVAGHDDAGQPLIDFAANPTGEILACRSLVSLPVDAVDREVAVMFEQGDLHRPIVLGLMASFERPDVELDTPLDSFEREVDDEQIVLTTDKRLVVRCGKASLTLTPAGKIILRGEYVLTRANGLNRIQGGSVQIN